MSQNLFRPTARQTNWLLLAGFLSVGYALYLRYLAVEQSTVGLACDAGLNTWLCFTRRNVTVLFNHQVFGVLALLAAIIHLLRPTLLIFAVALVAAGFGIVLYNVGLSAFAVGLLILSFARRAPATE